MQNPYRHTCEKRETICVSYEETPLTPESACPACAYERGYKDGVRHQEVPR